MKLQSSSIISVMVLLFLTSLVYKDIAIANIPVKRFETRAFVKSFGAQLKEKDIDKLRPYFSGDCFAQFLKSSDSLKNDYPRRISKAIELRQFAIEIRSDTTSVLSLGKMDVILGRTVGFFFINTTSGKHKIYMIRAPK